MPVDVRLGLGRPLFINLLSLPMQYRLLAVLPAVFLAILFFLDQNITVRTVNSPANKLRKGPAYHLDLMVLGLITGLVSITGLPWMCSATVERCESSSQTHPHRPIHPFCLFFWLKKRGGFFTCELNSGRVSRIFLTSPIVFFLSLIHI